MSRSIFLSKYASMNHSVMESGVSVEELALQLDTISNEEEIVASNLETAERVADELDAQNSVIEAAAADGEPVPETTVALVESGRRIAAAALGMDPDSEEADAVVDHRSLESLAVGRVSLEESKGFIKRVKDTAVAAGNKLWELIKKFFKMMYELIMRRSKEASDLLRKLKELKEGENAAARVTSVKLLEGKNHYIFDGSGALLDINKVAKEADDYVNKVSNTALATNLMDSNTPLHDLSKKVNIGCVSLSLNMDGSSPTVESEVDKPNNPSIKFSDFVSKFEGLAKSDALKASKRAAKWDKFATQIMDRHDKLAKALSDKFKDENRVKEVTSELSTTRTLARLVKESAGAYTSTFNAYCSIAKVIIANAGSTQLNLPNKADTKLLSSK